MDAHTGYEMNEAEALGILENDTSPANRVLEAASHFLAGGDLTQRVATLVAGALARHQRAAGDRLCVWALLRLVRFRQQAPEGYALMRSRAILAMARHVRRTWAFFEQYENQGPGLTKSPELVVVEKLEWLEKYLGATPQPEKYPDWPSENEAWGYLRTGVENDCRDFRAQVLRPRQTFPVDRAFRQLRLSNWDGSLPERLAGKRLAVISVGSYVVVQCVRITPSETWQDRWDLRFKFYADDPNDDFRFGQQASDIKIVGSGHQPASSYRREPTAISTDAGIEVGAGRGEEDLLRLLQRKKAEALQQAAAVLAGLPRPHPLVTAQELFELVILAYDSREDQTLLTNGLTWASITHVFEHDLADEILTRLEDSSLAEQDRRPAAQAQLAAVFRAYRVTARERLRQLFKSYLTVIHEINALTGLTVCANGEVGEDPTDADRIFESLFDTAGGGHDADL
jgi:hypothetical protein